MVENGTLSPELTCSCCVSAGWCAYPQNNEMQLSTSMGMSNLVFFRTLRNSSDAGRFMIQAKEVSFLDFVRNKDGRAVEAIVRLTQTKALDLLADVLT